MSSDRVLRQVVIDLTQYRIVTTDTSLCEFWYRTPDVLNDVARRRLINQSYTR